MQLKRKLRLVLLGFVVAFGQLGASTYAAGSVDITVEASSTNAAPNQAVTLSFYVTPNGGTLNNIQAKVKLSNLSYVSYDATGSAFSLAFVPQDATAAEFEVAGAVQGASKGVSSKSLLLKTTINTGSAGTGSITFGEAQAHDNSTGQNGAEAMAVVKHDTTISIAGSGGTPAVASGSTSVVPVANAENGDAGVPMLEADLVAAEYTGVSADAYSSSSKKDTAKQLMRYGPILLIVLIVIIAMMLYMKRKARRLQSSAISIDSAATQATTQPRDNGDGPTIIHPGNK